MKFTSSFVAIVLLLSVSAAALPTPHTPYVEGRSFLSSITSKVGKDAASEGEAAAGSAKSSSSGGILSHLENFGSGGLSAAFKDLFGGGDSESTAASTAQTNGTVAARELDERSLFSSVLGTAGKDVAKDTAGAAGKAASGGIISEAKNAIVSEGENLVGSTVVGSIIDHFEGDSDSSATGAQTNATVAARELDERSLFSSVLGTAGKDAAKDAGGAAGKAASSGILSKAKDALISGAEGLVGSTVVGDVLDHFEGGDSDSATDAQANATVARMARVRRDVAW